MKHREKINHEVNKFAPGVLKFMKKAFTHIEIEGPELDLVHMDKNPLMIVSTHRSQADYFLLGSILHDLGVQNVRYAAGDNLTDLPILGQKFQKLGAFAVHRSKAGSRTYIRALAEKVSQMSAVGDNVVVFPEGGRSYDGHMMRLRSGLTGAHILSQWADAEKEHYFFPVAISYERLPELLHFDMLRKGKKIRAQSTGLINRLRGNMMYFGADIFAFAKFLSLPRLGMTYGSVYVDYDDPIALSSIVDIRALHNSKARDHFSAHHDAMRVVSDALYQKFLTLYRILPLHIVSAILNESKHESMSVPHICEKVPAIVADIRDAGRNIRSIESLTVGELVEKGLSQLESYKSLTQKHSIVTMTDRSVITYAAATLATPAVEEAS
jgi:1-acyl-sn-glycerol-3-phosphate acyltransferase